MRSPSVTLRIRLQPRASREEIVGVHGNGLKVRVTAPPIDDRANTDLMRFIAKKLGVASRDVTIVAGRTGREKVLRIAGVTAPTVEKRLGVTLPPP